MSTSSSLRRRIVTAVLGLGLAGVASGCASVSGTAGAAGGRVRVATTVAPITDIARAVIGNDADVTGLIPEGVDSHTFEPSPTTIRTLADSDVLFLDGLHLEGSTEEQAHANMPDGSRIVELGARTIARRDWAFDFSFPKAKGDPNPHLWMAPPFAERFAEIIRDEMVRRDPGHAAGYRSRFRDYAALLDRLDAAIARSISSIPADHRVLLTYHDAYAYFARRYGMRVLGAVQPSDFSEPSAREVRALIDQLRSTKVPAIFGSEVFPSTVLEQVAHETGVHYVDKLRDDELPGRPGSPEHTYVGMMSRDVELITAALGGDPTPLRSIGARP